MEKIHEFVSILVYIAIVYNITEMVNLVTSPIWGFVRSALNHALQ